MLCPKCGQEYEGAQCPRCDGPVILVNNADYLARRKAYEEQLKNKEKEEKNKKKEENDDFDIMSAIDGALTKKTNKNKKIHSKKKSSTARSKKNKGDQRNQTRNRKYENTKMDRPKGVTIRKKETRFNKKLKRIFMIVALALVLCLAIIGIYKLATRKNYELFFSYNDKIYSVTDLESEYICDEAGAVFAVDEKTFYDCNDLNLSGITLDSLSSNDGAYVAFVQYDEDAAKYFISVSRDLNTVDIAVNADAKELVALTDSGTLIYTDTKVLNQEGGTGSKSLYVAYFDDDLSYQTVQLDDDISRYFVYTADNMVVCLNGDGDLFEYNYKSKKKTSLFENVTTIIGMSSDYYNYYSYSANLVNEWDKCDTFVFATNNIYYLYDIGDSASMKLCKSSDSNMEFIYDDTNDYIYAINTDTVYYATVSSSEVSDLVELDNIKTARNIIYIYSTKELLFVDGESNVVRIKKGESSKIASNVKDGSLCIVDNTIKSISYEIDSTIYYCKTSQSSAISVYTGSDLSLTTGIVKYKNRLYFYTSSTELYSTNLKGKDLNQIGNITRFWLGSKLK